MEADNVLHGGGEVAAVVRRLECEDARAREVRVRLVDARRPLGVLSERGHVHPVRVVLAVVVDQSPVRVAAYVYSNCSLFLADFERPVLGCNEADFCK